jgi:hypothetical protein
VSVAAFIGSQRTKHGVPHAVTCRALGLSESWFYKGCGSSEGAYLVGITPAA